MRRKLSKDFKTHAYSREPPTKIAEFGVDIAPLWIWDKISMLERNVEVAGNHKGGLIGVTDG